MIRNRLRVYGWRALMIALSPFVFAAVVWMHAVPPFKQDFISAWRGE